MVFRVFDGLGQAANSSGIVYVFKNWSCGVKSLPLLKVTVQKPFEAMFFSTILI